MSQTLTDVFGELHKNMNCTFPLTFFILEIESNLQKYTCFFKKSSFAFILYFYGTNNVAIYKTPSGETGCLSNSQSLLVAQASRFLVHPFPSTQIVRLLGVAYHLLCSTCVSCVTYGTHGTLLVIECFPPLPLPREAKGFHRSGKYYNHVPLFTQLIYFPPKGFTQQVLFMCQGLLRNIILASRWF